MLEKRNPAAPPSANRAGNATEKDGQSSSAQQRLSQPRPSPELIEAARLFGAATLSDDAMDEWVAYRDEMTGEAYAAFWDFLGTDLGRAFMWQGQAYCPGVGVMWQGAARLREGLGRSAAARRGPRGDPRKRALAAFIMVLLDFRLPSSEILAAAHRVNDETDAPLAPAEVRELAEWCARRHSERRAVHVGE